MHVISRDSPCYFLTSVAKDRLPIFRTNGIKEIGCRALDEARKSEDYRYSSVRCWDGRPLEDEPLLVDIDQIKWRRSLR
jgi:hypothetical protein